jgi:hypothetical protein
MQGWINPRQISTNPFSFRFMAMIGPPSWHTRAKYAAFLYTVFEIGIPARLVAFSWSTTELDESCNSVVREPTVVIVRRRTLTPPTSPIRVASLSVLDQTIPGDP